jgi:large subunit ribosomal protein L23
MKLANEIIRALVRTEKSTTDEPKGKYLFIVSPDANKTEIKRAVEQMYKVKVANVNTLIRLGKMRRVRHQVGKTTDVKRAMVTLRAGQKIETA